MSTPAEASHGSARRPSTVTPVTATRNRAGALAVLVVLAGCSTTADVHSRQARPVDTAAVATSAEPTTAETSPSDSTTPGTEPAQVESLDWHDCAEEVEDDSMRCATLTVPLDYDKPSGDSIDLALVMMPAQGRRKGAVLFNPGGPGGSGVEPIEQAGATISAALGLERYDLIGFDPRGVDRSGGLRCLDDATMDKYLYLDDTPDDAAEQALLDEADAAFSDSCKNNYGDSLRLYSTENTARDMDRIRQALGDDQISFVGISYGTYLGATYATLFPDRVRAMVLDSAFEPNGDSPEQDVETQLVGFEHAFDAWAEWCQGRDDCAFHAADVGARWDALLQQLDDHPLSATDGRTVNQAVMDTATTAALYAQSQWPVLASALAHAETGDGTSLLAMADEYNGRNADGTFDTIQQSFTIIQCASGIDGADPQDPDALVAHLHEVAPRFSRNLTADDLTNDPAHSCPALTGQVTPVSLRYEGKAPIVIIGGTNDPATPIRWAEEMVGELGPSAMLVTFNGEGHGQLLVSTCVTDIEATVLTDLDLPDEGTTCDPDPPVERPEWWDSIPVPDGISEVVPLPELVGALGLSETLAYSETRTTSMSIDDTAQAYDDALSKAGFDRVDQPDLGLPDSTASVYITTSNEALVVAVLGPGALADEELAGAASAVPAGQTVVLLVHVPG